ncbi:hypothetical protein Nepgr_019457 [Nepenthes gracilis]|uniref:PRA1 family protein n=1 Tax=Nepenthes gracilis TaxID=150966 RepID=A0AAD3SX62_NEPGR|nr:hypothetical protein Nepgr_019457 [Nepenthes gracilis]
MANYSTATQRSSAASTTSPKAPADPPTNHTEDPRRTTSARRIRVSFSIAWPFNLPSTPEEALARIASNFAYFKLYYAIFLWAVLFISLIPRRKLSLLFLVLMTNVTVMYLLLLKAMPNSNLLKFIDRRAVLAVLAVATAVELILTGAGLHLLITLACTTSVMLGHAVLQVNNGLIVTEEDPSVAHEESGLLNGTDDVVGKV